MVLAICIIVSNRVSDVKGRNSYLKMSLNMISNGLLAFDMAKTSPALQVHEPSIIVVGNINVLGMTVYYYRCTTNLHTCNLR